MKKAKEEWHLWKAFRAVSPIAPVANFHKDIILVKKCLMLLIKLIPVCPEMIPICKGLKICRLKWCRVKSTWRMELGERLKLRKIVNRNFVILHKFCRKVNFQVRVFLNKIIVFRRIMIWKTRIFNKIEIILRNFRRANFRKIKINK